MGDERKEKILRNIRENYRQIEKSIVDQLYMEHDLHGTTIGTMREDIWEELFKMILPKKFVIEHSAFIIDSGNGISKEVDLVVFDETYTPYIFHYGKLKFIPIEAVAAVVECKSKNPDIGKITEWYNEIKRLETCNNPIFVRTATKIETKAVPTQDSTRPISILCAMDSLSDEQKMKKLFDFILVAQKDKETGQAHIEIIRNDKVEDIYSWYKELNLNQVEDKEGYIQTNMGKECEKLDELKKIKLKEYEITEEDGTNNSLLSFNFQLNQLLMLINNPMLFPHLAYVKMFKGEKGEQNEGTDCGNCG